ncbi:MAG TPA: photosystem II S4 domain protein, partial [Clostridia bacterium]|nr:photosystem II S4 domain protein [Clostridia bacterium]
MSWNREGFLESLPEEEKIFAAQIFDKINQVEKTKQPLVLDFLDPAKNGLINEIVKNFVGINCSFYGGYGQAERKRPVLIPDFYPRELIDAKLKAIEVRGNFSFRPVSHRDFLGAVLGLGIKREKIGDIILTDNGCQIITTEEIGEFLLFHLKKVG